MKISRIRAWRVELPLHEGRYSWSGGNSVSVFDSTIVRIDTDRGIAGWGEACPLGPAYLPAYAEGVRQGLAVLAPRLIGSDPTRIGEVNDLLDRALKGHPYVKAPLDIACWDILGKLAGLPVCRLLGGPWGADFVLYRAISQDSPDAMARKVAEYRAQGYRRFQLKVGGGVDEDIERIRAVASLLERGDVLVADANTGWLPHEAARVVRAASALDVYIEQPCATYEECLSIRRRTDHAFVLDEVITDLPALARGVADDAMDVVNIKISRVGGLTRAREMRDFCVRAGIAMTIEDSWGGDVTTAAIAHLAHSTPPSHLFSATDFNSYVTLNIASDPLRRANGRLAAPERPGLGVTPREELLGEPVLDVA